MLVACSNAFVRSPALWGVRRTTLALDTLPKQAIVFNPDNVFYRVRSQGRCGCVIAQLGLSTMSVLSAPLRPTMNVLVIARDAHACGPSDRIAQNLRAVPSVRSKSNSWSGGYEEHLQELTRGWVNTVLLQPSEIEPWLEPDVAQARANTFISYVRKKWPRVVFILWFANPDGRAQFLSATAGRRNHYLHIYGTSTSADYDHTFRQAEAWLQSQYAYDVALSFAGEDRAIVAEVKDHLSLAGVRVFYDRDYQPDLWGADLYQHFQTVYKVRSRYCVAFLSRHYGQKAWPKHEMRQAQARVFSGEGDYILPVRLDDSEIAGINETTGYLDARTMTARQIADTLLTKAFYGSFRPDLASTLTTAIA